METEIKTHYEGENMRYMTENDNPEDKTVNTELWNIAPCTYDYDAVPHNDIFKPFTAISIGTSKGQVAIIPLDESNRENAELIVTAVNACKTINPDNPLNVAKVIGDMHKALKMAYDYINDMQKENFEDRLAGILYDHQLEKTINLMTTTLKQATE